MLRFLTHKLKSQSLNDVQPAANEEEDTERDSGTESDDENLELEQQERDTEEMNTRNQHDTSSYGSLSPPLIHACDSRSNSPTQQTSDTVTLTTGYDDSTLDDLSSTSDFERCSFDFDRNSSEDELSVIDQLRELETEKRMWGEDRLNCDSAASTDAEIQQLLLPQPVLFSESPTAATPPTDSSKLVQHGAPLPLQRLYITSVTPVNTISPRKRTRQTSLSESTDEDTENSVRRPSLDFEKMQKTLVKKHCTHSIARTRIVRVRTVNTPLTRSKCLYKPEIYTFRSISMSPFNQMAVVDAAPFAF